MQYYNLAAHRRTEFSTRPTRAGLHPGAVILSNGIREEQIRRLDLALVAALQRFREGDFPRYAWYKDGGRVYEARLVNRGNGEYKGYPLSPDEWPDGIEELYG